ncbi:uncharacterized protein LOC126373340 isoform X4 [Pectinophora gossypiella]|nr:uncharacterized protein LOC126373340 isoform X4 [Pectinophora gossypiella]
MLKIGLLLYFINFFKISDAALGIIMPAAKPLKFSSQPGCYLAEYDIVMGFGESFYPTDYLRCMQYTCNMDGYINVATCGELMEGNCVRVKGNTGLRYPKCCDKIKCSKTKVKQSENNTKEYPSVDNIMGVKYPLVENALVDNNSTAENPVEAIDKKIPMGKNASNDSSAIENTVKPPSEENRPAENVSNDNSNAENSSSKNVTTNSSSSESPKPTETVAKNSKIEKELE